MKQIKFFEAFLNEVGKYPISFSDINLPLIKDYESYLFIRKLVKVKQRKLLRLVKGREDNMYS